MICWYNEVELCEVDMFRPVKQLVSACVGFGGLVDRIHHSAGCSAAAPRQFGGICDCRHQPVLCYDHALPCRRHRSLRQVCPCPPELPPFCAPCCLQTFPGRSEIVLGMIYFTRLPPGDTTLARSHHHHHLCQLAILSPHVVFSPLRCLTSSDPYCIVASPVVTCLVHTSALHSDNLNSCFASRLSQPNCGSDDQRLVLDGLTSVCPCAQGGCRPGCRPSCRCDSYLFIHAQMSISEKRFEMWSRVCDEKPNIKLAMADTWILRKIVTNMICET